MKAKLKQSGVTLMEMTVVIVVVAMLTALSTPAIRTLFDSLGSAGGTQAMIGAALSSARAIAIKEHRYAGIRFQKAYRPEGPLKAPQYMIFVIYEFPSATLSLTDRFRAVERLKPVKLPETIGVMDLRLGSVTNEPTVSTNDDISQNWQVRDTTTFSVVFSPSGKLVVHDVRVRNRDGNYRPDNGNTDPDKHSMDDIFNSLTNIRDYDIGMFYQDDYRSSPDLGLWEESSRSSFVIYDRTRFDEIDVNRRWSDYLSRLEQIYINPYTGRIISAD